MTIAILNKDKLANGVWEHITTEPIIITGGYKELKEVCDKHKVIPKIFAKPRSQNKGWEWKY